MVLLGSMLLSACTSVGAATATPGALAGDAGTGSVSPTGMDAQATGTVDAQQGEGTPGVVGTDTPESVGTASTGTPAAGQVGADVGWAGWPTGGWVSASPEAVGMDSARLETLMDFLEAQDLNLHSLVIIRRGYLVFNLNVYPNTSSTGQEIQSATKSVTSALVGIALQLGYLKSLDQKMVDFFPKRTIANLDARKQAITLGDLLSMTSGIDWPEATVSYASKENPVRAMWSSSDPLQYVLDRPMAAPPGTTFNYSTGNSQVLGAILEMASGQSLSDFANQRLFEPLGIHGATWHRMRGSTPGGSGLVLTARDMAKLGYLYLRGGQWGGKQLLPADWIAASTAKHIAAPAGGYGYGWWVTPNGGFTASGFGGQTIDVFPEQGLVVVSTGAMGMAQRTTLHNLITYFILPAVVSDQTLAASAASKTLKARLAAAAGKPAAQAPAELPPLAGEIAGKSYTLAANALDWKKITLEFPSKNEAALVVEYSGGGGARLAIGLDGVPRVGETLRTALVGRWDDEGTFTLQYEVIGGADGQTVRMAFAGNAVMLTLTSYVQGDVSVVKGEIN
jgi:CubicO group peptidase (beta-lactamase class C family)